MMVCICGGCAIGCNQELTRVVGWHIIFREIPCTTTLGLVTTRQAYPLAEAQNGTHAQTCH